MKAFIGWAIPVGVILLIVLGMYAMHVRSEREGEALMERSRQSVSRIDALLNSETQQNVAAYIAQRDGLPPPEGEPWYDGGTLHKSNGAEWAGASGANRNATAADFITSSLGNDWVERMGGVSELVWPAADLVHCVDGIVYDTARDLRETVNVADIATECIVTLEPDWTEIEAKW